MVDKLKNNATGVENQKDRELRAKDKVLKEILVNVDGTIAEVVEYQRMREKEVKEEVKWMVRFLKESVADDIGFGKTYGENFEHAKEVIRDYFKNTKDIEPYITTYASYIANDILSYNSSHMWHQSGTYSALLSILKEKKGSDIEVTIHTIDSKHIYLEYNYLGRYLSNGIKLIVQGNIPGFLVALDMQGGILEIRDNVGAEVACKMQGGILKIHGTVESFYNSAFEESNEGEIWLADNTGIIRCIYDGKNNNGKINRGVTDEYFTVEYRGDQVVIKAK